MRGGPTFRSDSDKPLPAGLSNEAMDGCLLVVEEVERFNAEDVVVLYER